ncbi:MAG: hypothetical protein ABIJ65_01695 [Chloroflexota bacterium]
MLSTNSLVLVCLLPKPRDLEIARLLGWYRIPLRSAPKLVAVDYLAFYQPASFGPGGSRIDFVAEVRGNELTTRSELLRDEQDHPHANEEYYKIQIGCLEKLDHPILAETWKRLTFLYTTGEYILQARTINDLVVKSVERQSLWKALRERSSSESVYQPDQDDFKMDDSLLSMLLGFQQLLETPEDD